MSGPNDEQGLQAPVDDIFGTASRRALAYLNEHVPMQFWAVSRVVSGRQVYLTVTDNPYELRAGDGPLWRESLCQVMWDDSGPQIAPVVEEAPQYRHRLKTVTLPVAAYVGIPLLDAGGELFGTVCGVDSTPQSPDLAEHQPLLDLLGHMLSGMLQLEQHAQQLDRTLVTANRAAQTDPMTGVLNRRAWDQVVAVEAARHRPLADPWSVLVVDLDGLKAVNDRDGHVARDELIMLMASVLTSTSRTHDAVARLGGDEFAVLCPMTDTDQVEGRATRLQETCDLIDLKASIGWATHTHGDEPAATIAAADHRMYADKRRRRADS